MDPMNRQQKQGGFTVSKTHRTARDVDLQTSKRLAYRALRHATARVTSTCRMRLTRSCRCKKHLKNITCGSLKLLFLARPLASFFPSLASSITVSEATKVMPGH